MANEKIAAECAAIGMWSPSAPRLSLSWHSRWETHAPGRRAELRKLAATRLAALTATAESALDEWAVATETALIADGLESDEARACLDRMPAVEELMPPVGLKDLGLKHYGSRRTGRRPSC